MHESSCCRRAEKRMQKPANCVSEELKFLWKISHVNAPRILRFVDGSFWRCGSRTLYVFGRGHILTSAPDAEGRGGVPRVCKGFLHHSKKSGQGTNIRQKKITTLVPRCQLAAVQNRALLLEPVAPCTIKKKQTDRISAQPLWYSSRANLKIREPRPPLRGT